MTVQHIITAPIILQIIFNAFLLFFFFIWPSSNMGTTNQIHRPMIINRIIKKLKWSGGTYPPLSLD